LKFASPSCLTVAVLLALAGVTHAQVLTNLAVSEHGTVTTVFGYNNGSNLSAFGTEYEQYGGSKATLNDGTTGIDGYNSTTFGNEGGRTSTSYGFGGYENLVVPTGMEVTSVNLFQYAFGDGGWFGPNSDFSSNNPLKASDLSEPLLQATTDDGATWTTIAATDNYLSQYTNIANRNSNLPEVAFTLSVPLTGIDGIRVIGLNGGYAGTGADSNSTSGFMSMTELQIEAQVIPEPSTYAMMLGGLALLGFCVRRKAARS
jgi:hypothetical protein